MNATSPIAPIAIGIASARREPQARRAAPLDLEAFADGAVAAVANDAAPASVAPPAPPRGPRRRVLTHEEEVDLAQRIEAGERDALHALLGSPHAAVPLRSIAAELRAGRVMPSGLVRNAEEEADTPAGVERLAKMLDRAALGAAAPRVATTEVDARAAAARRRIRLATELSGQCRFERAVFDRIARALPHPRRGRVARAGPSLRGRRTAERAVHEFVGANFGLVVTYARRFVGQGLDMHDPRAGRSARPHPRCTSREEFDWRRGHRFSTYAAWWVRQAMAHPRPLADQSKTIRVPVHLLESRHKLERVRRAMAQQGERDPSDEELARASGLLIDKVRAIRGLVRERLSGWRRLSATRATAGSSAIASRTSVLARARRAPGPGSHAGADPAPCSSFSPREQQLLRLRFGMDGGPGQTLEEVGKSFNLSRERVRQIEAAALKKLRAVSRRARARLLHRSVTHP